MYSGKVEKAAEVSTSWPRNWIDVKATGDSKAENYPDVTSLCEHAPGCAKAAPVGVLRHTFCRNEYAASE